MQDGDQRCGTACGSESKSPLNLEHKASAAASTTGEVTDSWQRGTMCPTYFCARHSCELVRTKSKAVNTPKQTWFLSGHVVWRKEGGKSRGTEKDQVSSWQKTRRRGEAGEESGLWSETPQGGDMVVDQSTPRQTRRPERTCPPRCETLQPSRLNPGVERRATPHHQVLLS